MTSLQKMHGVPNWTTQLASGIPLVIVFLLVVLIALGVAVCVDRLGTFWRNIMLNWALTFLIIALIAGVLGFGGIAGEASWVAHVLFVVFLILFLVSLLSGRRVPPV